MALPVCTLDTTTNNNIVQTNGTQREYMQELNVECMLGYKLSYDSDNSATNKTLSCQESGEFNTPPVCVKKGNNIRMFLVIRKLRLICFNMCVVLTDFLGFYSFSDWMFLIKLNSYLPNRMSASL